MNVLVETERLIITEMTMDMAMDIMWQKHILARAMQQKQ
jgi:hypothetical protein